MCVCVCVCNEGAGPEVYCRKARLHDLLRGSGKSHSLCVRVCVCVCMCVKMVVRKQPGGQHQRGRLGCVLDARWTSVTGTMVSVATHSCSVSNGFSSRWVAAEIHDVGVLCVHVFV